MLTRKRQRDNKIQNRFNASTLTQSNQFHPILESITIFLGFKDVSNVARLSTEYHLKTWIYILKSNNRSISELINVNFKSVVWLEKYSNSLKNQHLSLWSIQHHSHNYHKYRHTQDLTNFENAKVIDFLTQRQEIHSFKFGPPLHVSENVQVEILENVAHHLKELMWLTMYMHHLPFFPKLESLHLTLLLTPKPQLKNMFELIAKQCPVLKNLILDNDYITDMTGISNTIQKLTIHSQSLRSLESLRCVNLKELDVSECMFITDFSPVSHIPIVKKFDFQSPWRG
jgi:hypothetical protein